MYKSTARSEQFYNREGSFSTRPSVRGVNLLGWELPEELTEEQKIECLRSRLIYLRSFLEDGLLTKEQRRIVGQEINQRNSELSILKPRKQMRGLPNIIVDVVKERLSKQEWKAIITEAIMRWDAKHGTPDHADH